MSRRFAPLLALTLLGAGLAAAEEDPLELSVAGGRALMAGELAEAGRLFEAARALDDELPVAWLGLAEANWEARKGHNLKLTYEHFDPDDDVSEDEQNRYSVVCEYFPFQFTQFRLGVREYDGIDQNDLQNQTEYFLELHGYF